MKKLLGVVVVIVLLAIGASAWADTVYCSGPYVRARSYIETADGHIHEGTGWVDPWILNPRIEGDRLYIPESLSRAKKSFFFVDTMVKKGGIFYRVKTGLKELPIFSRRLDTGVDIRREAPLPANPDLLILGNIDKDRDGWRMILPSNSTYGIAEESRDRYVLLRDLEVIDAGPEPATSEDTTKCRYTARVPTLTIYSGQSWNSQPTKEPVLCGNEIPAVLAGLKLERQGRRMVLPPFYSFGTNPEEFEKPEHERSLRFVYRTDLILNP